MALNRIKDGHKACARCQRTFPRTPEYWHKNKPQSDGLHNYCKECRCALNKERYARLCEGRPAPPRKSREDKFDYRAWHKGVRMELLIAYSQDPPSCACCGEMAYEFLSIDHVNGDGRKNRTPGRRDCRAEFRRLRRTGYPNKERYQVLCHNCNQALGLYGYCPHRPELTRPLALAARRKGVRTHSTTDAHESVS